MAAGWASGIAFAGGVGYMKPKALGAFVVCCGYSVVESAAGYMKPKAEVAVEAAGSSSWETMLGPHMNEKAGA